MLATANTGKLGRGFGKNAGEWTGKVEILGSKRSMHGNNYTDLLQALKGETLHSVFSSVGTFNFCVRSSPLRGHALKPDVKNFSWKKVDG